MQKEWSSLRITLLLYLAILLLPFSFYFVYTSFETIQQDTKTVRQSSWLAGAIGHTTHKNDLKTIDDIDKTLQSLSIWTAKNNDTQLYIGTNTLSEDFSKVKSCWMKNKNDLTVASTQCYTLSESMALNIEKMVYLQQKKIINIFYISLTLGMTFILLTIYLVRTYIYIQMKKHAIRDHETHLFNQKYFLSELHSTFSRSIRHENPLSLLFVSLNGFTEKTYDKKTKRNLMKELGEMFTSVTRNSDISCRYDENHFAVLLPLTDREHALILEGRLREALEKHDFKVDPEIDFSFATTQADVEESEETFINRAKKNLTL